MLSAGDVERMSTPCAQVLLAAARTAETAGEEGVVAAVRALTELTEPADLVNRLCADLLGDAAIPPSDDATVVCLRRSSRPAAARWISLR